jgi:hypothetical protein
MKSSKKVGVRGGANFYGLRHLNEAYKKHQKINFTSEIMKGAIIDPIRASIEHFVT